MNTPFSQDNHSVEGCLPTEGSKSAEGPSSAEGSLSADGSLSAEGSLSADGSLSAEGSLSADGSSEATTDFQSADWAIGCWVVEPMLNRLHQPGREDSHRAVEPRLMQLLCYLRANPERVATRDELVKALWPKVVVNENSLTRAVSELRKQLATDKLPGASFIETIPKKGYRLSPAMVTSSAFVHSTVDAAESPNSSAAHLNSAPQPTGSPNHNQADPLLISSTANAHLLQNTSTSSWTAMSSAAALVLALGLWAYQLVPVITAPGEVTASRTLLAELNDEMKTWGDDEQGWDRVIDHGAADLWNEGSLTLSPASDSLTEESHHSTPVMSFDNESFAFVQCDNSGFTVYVGQTKQLPLLDPTVQIAAQLTQELLSKVPSVAVFHSQERIQNVSWSPLGDALLFAQFSKVTKTALYSNKPASARAMEGAALMLLDLDTLEATQITPADSTRDVSDDSADMMTLT